MTQRVRKLSRSPNFLLEENTPSAGIHRFGVAVSPLANWRRSSSPASTTVNQLQFRILPGWEWSKPFGPRRRGNAVAQDCCVRRDSKGILEGIFNRIFDK